MSRERMNEHEMQEFFLIARRLIDRLLEQPNIFSDTEMHSYTTQAWDEILPYFEKMQKEILADTYNQELINAGLTNSQWKLKISAIKKLIELEDYGKAWKGCSSIFGSMATFIGLPGAEMSKELFDFIDIIIN